MSEIYAGQERRKSPLLEQINRRLVFLELMLIQMSEGQTKLGKDFSALKDICRGCAGFQQDDFK